MSIAFLLQEIFGSQSDKERKFLYEFGTFLMGGVFAGVLLNDVWKRFNFPGVGHPVTIRGEGEKNYNWSHIYQQGVIWSIMVGGAVTSKNNLIPLAFGMLLGESWGRSSDKGEYIGGT